MKKIEKFIVAFLVMLLISQLPILAENDTVVLKEASDTFIASTSATTAPSTSATEALPVTEIIVDDSITGVIPVVEPAVADIPVDPIVVEEVLAKAVNEKIAKAKEDSSKSAYPTLVGEIETLARIYDALSGSALNKIAWCNLVVNRACTKGFPNTVASVINGKNQFPASIVSAIKKTSEASLEARLTAAEIIVDGVVPYENLYVKMNTEFLYSTDIPGSDDLILQAYDLPSDADLYLLTGIIYAEAGITDEAEMAYAGSVVLNRRDTAYYCFDTVDSIYEVIHQRNQYATASVRQCDEFMALSEEERLEKIEQNENWKKAYKVAKGLLNGTIERLPMYVLFQFRADMLKTWSGIAHIDMETETINAFFAAKDDPAYIQIAKT